MRGTRVSRCASPGGNAITGALLDEDTDLGRVSRFSVSDDASSSVVASPLCGRAVRARAGVRPCSTCSVEGSTGVERFGLLLVSTCKVEGRPSRAEDALLVPGCWSLEGRLITC
jgi:hypothetical protein